MIGSFKTWLMEQTRIVRYFIVALLFHVVIAVILGSIKIVAVLPKIVAAFDSTALPPKEALTEPDDPYAAYRDFDYKGVGTVVEKPAGPAVPEAHLAHIEASPQQSGIADVIGVESAEATELARPVGVVGPLGPSLSAGDLKVGIPGIKGPGGFMVGSRSGRGRAIALNKYGASKEVERAIITGLNWLKANQQPDGSWKMSDRPVGGTALAVLCFLGHGETTDSKEYGTTVTKALDYLVSKVSPSGAVAGSMYEQGLVMLALAEGLTMTGSPALRLPLERAVKATIAAQNIPGKGNHAGGWRYGLTSKDSDVSVTGWVIMGLKSAKNAGIEVPDEVFTKATQYLWRMYSPQGGFGYSSPATTPSTSAAGALCMQFMGRGAEHRLKAVYENLVGTNVGWNEEKGNWLLYQWYYTTQAMFQAADPYWPVWNKKFRDQYVKNQAKDGHWDAPPNSGNNEKKFAPVYSTTLAILTLEVYYRYLPMYQILEQQKAAPAAAATGAAQ